MLIRVLSRALVQTSRRLTQAQQVVAELALAMHDPRLERGALDEAYRRLDHYKSEENQRLGLFPFEARALAQHFPTAPAALLIHGAGGGREVRALRAQGYRVDAFEPVQALVAAARLDDPTAPAIQPATLQSWAKAPVGRYDGVVLGWGLWTHLLLERDRLDALCALRKVCPHGPVLLSFWRAEATADQREHPVVLGPLHPDVGGRLQRLTRGWLRSRLLGRPPLERGTRFARGLFVHLVSEAELRHEAESAGYAVAYFERDLARYGNAVLKPV